MPSRTANVCSSARSSVGQVGARIAGAASVSRSWTWTRTQLVNVASAAASASSATSQRLETSTLWRDATSAPRRGPGEHGARGYKRAASAAPPARRATAARFRLGGRHDVARDRPKVAHAASAHEHVPARTQVRPIEDVEAARQLGDGTGTDVAVQIAAVLVDPSLLRAMVGVVQVAIAEPEVMAFLRTHVLIFRTAIACVIALRTPGRSATEVDRDVALVLATLLGLAIQAFVLGEGAATVVSLLRARLAQATSA